LSLNTTTSLLTRLTLGTAGRQPILSPSTPVATAPNPACIEAHRPPYRPSVVPCRCPAVRYGPLRRAHGQLTLRSTSPLSRPRRQRLVAELVSPARALDSAWAGGPGGGCPPPMIQDLEYALAGGLPCCRGPLMLTQAAQRRRITSRGPEAEELVDLEVNGKTPGCRIAHIEKRFRAPPCRDALYYRMLDRPARISFMFEARLCSLTRRRRSGFGCSSALKILINSGVAVRSPLCDARDVAHGIAESGRFSFGNLRLAIFKSGQGDMVLCDACNPAHSQFI